jgi:hypothetical protein
MDYIYIPLITVVELPEFIKQAEKQLSQKEYDELLYYLAANPKPGSYCRELGE